jgi:hypothetical protein
MPEETPTEPTPAALAQTVVFASAAHACKTGVRFVADAALAAEQAAAVGLTTAPALDGAFTGTYAALDDVDTVGLLQGLQAIDGVLDQLIQVPDGQGGMIPHPEGRTVRQSVNRFAIAAR